jgi:hypothetical protein
MLGPVCSIGSLWGADRLKFAAAQAPHLRAPRAGTRKQKCAGSQFLQFTGNNILTDSARASAKKLFHKRLYDLWMGSGKILFDQWRARSV